jgi:hypothetical protein
MSLIPELHFFRTFVDAIDSIRTAANYGGSIEAMLTDLLPDEPVEVRDEVRDLVQNLPVARYHFALDRVEVPAYIVLFAGENEQRFLGEGNRFTGGITEAPAAVTAWSSRMGVACVAERPLEVAYMYHLAKCAIVAARKRLALVAQFGQVLSGQDLGVVNIGSRLVYRRDLLLELRHPQAPKMPGMFTGLLNAVGGDASVVTTEVGR